LSSFNKVIAEQMLKLTCSRGLDKGGSFREAKISSRGRTYTMSWRRLPGNRFDRIRESTLRHR